MRGLPFHSPHTSPSATPNHNTPSTHPTPLPPLHLRPAALFTPPAPLLAPPPPPLPPLLASALQACTPHLPLCYSLSLCHAHADLLQPLPHTWRFATAYASATRTTPCYSLSLCHAHAALLQPLPHTHRFATARAPSPHLPLWWPPPSPAACGAAASCRCSGR